MTPKGLFTLGESRSEKRSKNKRKRSQNKRQTSKKVFAFARCEHSLKRVHNRNEPIDGVNSDGAGILQTQVLLGVSVVQDLGPVNAVQLRYRD